MKEAFISFLNVFNVIVVVYFLLLNGVYLITSIFSFKALRRYAWRLKSVDVEEMIRTAGAPPITVIIPAYNEETTCVNSVLSLLSLSYPEYEVMVVNDGSQDQTLDKLVKHFNMKPAARIKTAEIPTAQVREVYHSYRYPNLWLVDKENGGKADSLNAAINFCQTPLFCAMDADSILEPDALIRVVRPFLEDAQTIAAGGTIRVANGCDMNVGRVVQVGLPKKFLPRVQVLEYLRAFLAARMGWDAMGATLVISGAFGLFRRASVVEIGGYANNTVGEDMELIVRLHHHHRKHKIPYAMHYIPDPVAWTECPEKLKTLGCQRDRWQRGLYESLTRHMGMMFNPRYGRVGMLAFPFYFFLEMIGPLIEILGYITFALALIFGQVSLLFGIAFFMVAVVMGISISYAAIGLEELCFRRYQNLKDLVRFFWLGILENIGYRQLVTLWRAKGLLFSFLGIKKGWGKQERKGFKDQPQQV